jgi:hypothetical protein
MGDHSTDVYNELADIYLGSKGLQDYFLEPVTHLEHANQCAFHALLEISKTSAQHPVDPSTLTEFQQEVVISALLHGTHAT